MQVEPIPVAEEVKPERIPLTVSFFLLSMVAFAIWNWLFCIGEVNKYGGNLLHRRAILSYATALINAPLVVTWLFLIKSTLNKGPRFPVSAGHWFCLLFPISAVTSIITSNFFEIHFGKDRTSTILDPSIAGLFVFGFTVLQSLIYCIAFIDWKRLGHWRIYLLIAFAFNLVLAIFALATCIVDPQIMMPFYTVDFYINFRRITTVLKIVLATKFVISDIRHRDGFDWIHFLGVGTIIYSGLFYILWDIFAQ